MVEKLPADWAIERALDLGWRPNGPSPFEDAKRQLGKGQWPCLAAFARYIEAHEKPPVDPLLIEARKIAANELVLSGNSFTAQEVELGQRDGLYVAFALAGLRRGIELAGPRGEEQI